MTQAAEWWIWYTAYLRSPEWAEFREYAFRFHGRRCAECRRTERDLGPGEWLEIDHLTYERVGHELLEDVQVLCNTHHGRKTQRERLLRKVKRWLRV